MNGDGLWLALGPESALPNEKSGGNLYVTEDTQNMYVDTNNLTRIRITDILVVDTLTTLNNITSPVNGKFYYCEGTNTFYKRINGTWTPVGSGVFTNSSADVEADRLRSAVSMTLTGDVTGTANFDGEHAFSLTTDIANSGVTAGTYGTSTDTSLGSDTTFIVPKITVAADGRVTGVTSITMTMPTSMGATNMIVGGANNSTANAEANNGYVFLNLLEGSTIKAYHNIVGRGSTTVTANSAGSIFIESDNDNTTYDAVDGLVKSPSETVGISYDIGHSNILSSAGTVQGSTGAIGWGGDISIPKFTYDINGHITSVDYTTATIPAQPTDKEIKTSVAATTKSYLVGVTSSTGGDSYGNIDTDVYLDTTAGHLTATQFNGALNGNAATATNATNDASGRNIATTYAPLASPALTGTPTAPTASMGTNSTQIATTAYVTSAIAALGDTLRFKGTLGTGGTVASLPATYQIGDEYKVVTAGTYAGNACEVGDMIIALGASAGATDVITFDAYEDNEKAVELHSGTANITATDSTTTTITFATYGDNNLVGNTYVIHETGLVAGSMYRLYDSSTDAALDIFIDIQSIAAAGSASDWCVVQGNIDGAVTTADSTTTDQITVTKPTASSIRVNHATSGATAGSYGTSANATLTYGGTFVIPCVTVNDTGHITSVSSITLTMPGDSNVNDSVTNTLNTTTKAYVTGTTNNTTNTGGLVFDTGVYLDTTAGHLTATQFNGPLNGNAATATKLNTAIKLEGTSVDGSADITYFGTCSTAAATAAKEVTIGGTFTLGAGARVIVKFANANTAANMALSVNGTTSTGVYCQNTQIGNDGTIVAGGVYEMVYDGSRWNVVGTMRSISSDTSSDSDYVAASTAMVNGYESGLAITIDDAAWSDSTTTINGTAYYTFEYTATKVWTAYPTCVLAPMDTNYVLPSANETKQFNKINAATGNTSSNKITFYATTLPECDLKIVVRGAK